VIGVSGPAHLALADRALQIERNREVIGKIPLEDIAVITLDGPDVSLTHQLLGACVSHRVTVVVADDRHLPSACLLPLAGHSTHTAILRQQIDASKPAMKRTWQAIIRAKVTAQSQLALSRTGDNRSIQRLIAFIRSGDPDNVEGQAAHLYFETVFGPDFRRDRQARGVNGLLNYGYAVLRAAVARAVVGAGLHPALGIHHRNQYNALCLADDAMEPLRPLVDRLVLEIDDESADDELEVTPPIKRELISVLTRRVVLHEEVSPLLVALDRYAADLRRAICQGEEIAPPIPLIE
jgi:CRISPR-associated protein Cas1